VFVSVLNLKPGMDRGDARFRVSAEWDSLTQMALVVAIENEFGLELTAGQVIELETFDSALAIVTASVPSV
jgi:acyl carrier protein